ncbi:unnamed protein product [Orchesella dallaii]|uniref:Secreted protein n=1 Tax=Orchesella dallaii TaxID=48710 RepID=A0ABP1R2K0_9HEXA
MARLQIISLMITLVVTLSINTSTSNAFPSSDQASIVPSSGSKLQWRNQDSINADEAQDPSFVSEERYVNHADRNQDTIRQANANIQSPSSQTLHRVKRNRPKIRYNRNKDVVRDY